MNSVAAIVNAAYTKEEADDFANSCFRLLWVVLIPNPAQVNP